MTGKPGNISEKDALLSLTKGVSWRRAKEELMHMVKDRFFSMFHFFHCTISIVSDDKKFFKVVFLDPESKLKGHKDYQELITRNNIVADGVFDKVLASKIPLVIDVDRIAAHAEPPFYAKIIQESGLKEILAIALHYDAEPIGVMTFFGEKKGSFIPEFFPLVQGIADQLSMAVINTLANEELERKILERDLMLELSNAIAHIKTRSELQKVIKEKIRDLFPVCLTALLQFNPETKLITPFFDDPNLATEIPSKIESWLLQHVAGSEDLVVGDFNEKEVQAITLGNGKETLGFLLLYSDKNRPLTKDGLVFIKAAAHHLSSAMANILSTEAIFQREQEKDILLSVGNELTYVRERSDLLPLLKKQLERLSFYTDVTIARIDDNKQTFSAFVINEDPVRLSHPGYVEMANAHHPYPDGVFDVCLASERPLILDIEELAAWTKPLPYIKFLHENGTIQMVAIRLRDSNTENGVLFMFSGKKRTFTEFQLTLVQGIGNQLGAVVGNILANEKIEKQLHEIRQYKEKLEEEKMYLQEQVSSGYTYSDIIGNGNEMQKVFLQLSQVSFANSTVLLLGETGTGKELVARAIHNSSPRKDRLMVKVNCAALPASLIESELFGHEKGSFTGAIERRIGKFELANHGTLFLDEIGEMPHDLQVKLLRAIQEREIERIGGKATIKTDVRIIAATNRNLEREMEEGRFRRDLYYRLNVFPITLPPLRERTEDIPLLVRHFTEKYAKNTGTAQKNVSAKAMKELMSYGWPGNIRELEHVLERCILTTKEGTIKVLHLPATNRNELKQVMEEDYLKTYEENEKEHILKVLTKCKGKIFGPGGAAEVLNLPVSTLNSKIKRLGIKQNRIYSE